MENYRVGMSRLSTLAVELSSWSSHELVDALRYEPAPEIGREIRRELAGRDFAELRGVELARLANATRDPLVLEKIELEIRRRERRELEHYRQTGRLPQT